MEFGFLRAPPPLAHLVKTVWYAQGLRSEFDHPEPIVSDGCVELIFNFADPFEQIVESGARVRQPLDLLVGPSIRPTTAVATGRVDLLGLRCRPGRTSAFMRASMSSLTDRIVPMSAVLPGTARLLDDLRELPPERRLDHLVAAWEPRARASQSKRSDAVSASLDAIARHRGNVPITRLSSMTGVSQRHLERQFRDEVGLAAKHVARIARIQHVLAIATDPSLSGADIAAQCGYTDQAHLIRECRELTGTTPARLLTTQTTLATLMREG